MINNINRRKFLAYFACGCSTLCFSSCSTVPITDRKQLNLISESKINRQASQVYEQVKKKSKLVKGGSDLNSIKLIGNKIENAVTNYFINEKKDDPTTNFEWEYILIDNDKMANAWCMPGGKIAVYTGMLKITKNINALSIVMGHEIAHAVAKHSIERQSQAITLNLGTQIADIFLGGAINRTRSTVGSNTGLDIFQIGILNPFGRKQESEADYLGLIFSSLAGYDIRESIPLWQRMAAKNKKKSTTIFKHSSFIRK